jgi:U3 small nucleolar RNA-associated protein 19
MEFTPSLARKIKMADGTTSGMAGVKRKRESSKSDRHQAKAAKPKSRRKSPSADDDEPQTAILQLESQILESRRHYNNIATLTQFAGEHESQKDVAILAAVALCRVFARLLSTGDMVKSKGMPQSEAVIVQWLKERYREFQDLLLQYLRNGDASTQSAGLTLLMRLVKEESQNQKEYNWKHGPLSRIVEAILFLPEDDPMRDEFAEKYFKSYDDIRFYTFQIITYV